MSRTPGPWEVGGLDDTMVVTHSAQIVVAWTRRDRDPFTDEKKSNALLIAAAPDLADALKEAVDCYGKPGGPWNVPSDPGGWLERARAALRKAGEIHGEVGG